MALRRRVAALALGAAVLGSVLAPLMARAELSAGQVVVAFLPQLSGDPQQDFTLAVRAEEVFTVYLIAGPLPESTRGIRLSIGISEATNVWLSEVRSFGKVLAHMNSIGTFVGISVDSESGCIDRDSESVLAEIDLARQSAERPVQLRLAGANVLTEPPEYINCQGTAVAFDDSVAQPLTLSVPPPVPVSRHTWSGVKDIYRTP